MENLWIHPKDISEMRVPKSQEETRSLINNQSLHLNHTYDPILYNLENLLT